MSIFIFGTNIFKYLYTVKSSFWKLIFGNAQDFRNFQKLIPLKISCYTVCSCSYEAILIMKPFYAAKGLYMYLRCIVVVQHQLKLLQQYQEQ